MSEETLFKSEQRQTREEIADFVDSVGDQLADGTPFSLTSDTESVTVRPPPELTFEVEVERVTHSDPEAANELSFEVEIEWPDDAEPNPENG